MRWKSFSLGAVVFVAAHLVEMAFWRAWFQPGGEFAPWFLNSGRAVAFTASLLFVAGALLGLIARGAASDAIIAAGNLAMGAAVAMAVVLGVVGSGTLFPIALAIGGGVALVSSLAGALAVSAITKAFP